jgi:hypothetical protein
MMRTQEDVMEYEIDWTGPKNNGCDLLESEVRWDPK